MSGTEVILLRSTDVGAPTLSGTAGALIALLDACLKDGYNAKTIQSITRSGTTATVTYATAHNYAADGLTKVLIAGCDQPEYNGIKQITNVSTNSFDFTVSGTPASGSGTMTSKAAPLGWDKPFAGTNKGVYRSPEVTGTRLYLRVDDANPKADTNKTALMRGYETMTDVDTGVGLFPTVAQMVDGVYFWKSGTSDSVARPWVLVGDGFEFHLFSSESAGYPNISKQFHFGDPASEMASDPYGCLIYGNTSAWSNSQPEAFQATHSLAPQSSITPQAGHYIARLYGQVGSSVGASKHSQISFGSYNAIGSSSSYPMPYPAPHNNGLYVAPIFIHDGSVLRGQLKGLYQPLHARPLGHAGLCHAASSPISRRLYAVATAYSTSTPGETHVDIDGPWR
jgi:hypothetical protein